MRYLCKGKMTFWLQSEEVSGNVIAYHYNQELLALRLFSTALNEWVVVKEAHIWRIGQSCEITLERLLGTFQNVNIKRVRLLGYQQAALCNIYQAELLYDDSINGDRLIINQRLFSPTTEKATDTRWSQGNVLALSSIKLSVYNKKSSSQKDEFDLEFDSAYRRFSISSVKGTVMLYAQHSVNGVQLEKEICLSLSPPLIIKDAPQLADPVYNAKVLLKKLSWFLSYQRLFALSIEPATSTGYSAIYKLTYQD